MSLMQVLGILWARAWIIAITLIVGVSASIVVVLLLPERYTASSSVILDVGDLDPVTGLPQNTARTYILTQTKLVQSTRVSKRVVERLELTQSPYFLNEFNSAKVDGIDLKTWIGRTLLENLQVEATGGSEILTIHYSANSPALAARVANAFAEAYLLVDLELRVDPAKRNAQWYAAQLNKLRLNLEEAQEELTQYQKQVGIVSLNSEEMTDSQRIGDLESRTIAARAEASDARSMVKQFNAFKNSGGKLDTLPEFLVTPEIDSHRQELGKIDAAIATLSGRVGQNHPQYKAIVARRAAVVDQIQTEISSLESSILANVDISNARAATLEEELQSEKETLLKAKEDRNILEAMAREVEIRKAEYDDAFRRASTLRRQGELAQTGVSIVEEATPPTEASFPKKRLAVGAAFVASLALGLGLSFLLEMVDRRVRSEKDIETIDGVVVLASIVKGRKNTIKKFDFKQKTQPKHTTNLAAE